MMLPTTKVFPLALLGGLLAVAPQRLAGEQEKKPEENPQLDTETIVEGIDVEEGVERIELFVHLSPDWIDAQVVLGWGLHKRGEHAKAVEILESSWEQRRTYNHEHKIWLEQARNALAGQQKTDG